MLAVSHSGPRVPFVITRPEGFDSPYRLTLLFDNKRGYTTIKLCGQDPGAFEPAWNGKLRIHAALCANEKPLTSVFGQIDGLDGPNDPRFRKLIGHITHGLFPPYDPDRRDPSERFLTPLGRRD